jgi:succinate-acetate transporter protein
MSSIEKVEKGETGTTGTSEHAAVPSLTNAHMPHRVPSRRLGNPGPLGLFSFASTTLILSLYNAQVRGITVPNVVVGMACFVGGLAQLLAGMWEFACGNTFGATAFTSYGGFWLSFATIFIPGSGILDAFTAADAPASEVNSALGIYLITWFIITLLLFIASLRRNAGLIALFACLTVTFLLLAVGKFLDSTNTTKAGGGLGVVTALIAYYVGLAELLVREESWVTLPLGTIPKRID